MGRAVATLAALAGMGLGELRMPAYYEGTTIAFAEGGPQSVTDYLGRDWQLVGTGEFEGQTISGWIVYPSTDGTLVWNSENYTFGYDQSGSLFDWPVTSTRPMAFLNFGARFADDDAARAEAIAGILWDGMQGPFRDPEGGTSYAFYNTVMPDIDSTQEGRWRPHRRNVFLRALLRRGDPLDLEYLNHHRDPVTGESEFGQLAWIFGQNAYDLGNNSHRNLAHLFADDGSSYGVRFTRRDLLDAMELMCEVAASMPDADVPPPQPVEPPVFSIDDLGGVQLYAERVADRIDEIARRQVVQDVPIEVVRHIQGEPTAAHPGSGDYGDLMRQLRVALRNLGNAPRDIAGALRDISVALDTMKRNQQIFQNDITAMWLGLIVRAITATIECLSAGIAAAGSCSLAGALLAVDTFLTDLGAQSRRLGFENEVDSFVLRVHADFDQIETKQTDMANAADEVRRILGQLRSARLRAQSALASALFADSDAAGRHYPVNTAMRRIYDINLQRYRAAHEASRQLALVARLAVEQRLGVNLDEQMCASLGEPPSMWAGDVCNTSGVNYGQLRDPEADVSADAIRSMFVGDYVRRLEQYVESYRFDYPYSSGEDLMIISLRDDILRPRGRCVEETVNLLGASNDLMATVLPSASGDLSERRFRAKRSRA